MKRRLFILLSVTAIVCGCIAYIVVGYVGHTITGLRLVREVPLSGGSSRFDYESLDPQRSLLFIAHLGASLVTVFDTKTQKVITNIPDISQVHGVLAVPRLGVVYASATGANEIAVIREKNLQVVARIPGGVYPDGIAYDPDTHQIFVSDEMGGTVTVIDTVTDRRVATIALGGEVGNTQYDPVSHLIFSAVQSKDMLAAIDPMTDRVIAFYPLSDACVHPHGLIIDAPNRLAYVACDENARLLTVDLRSMHVTSVHSVGFFPDVLALDSVLHRLYVASESGILTIFQQQNRPAIGDLQKIGEGYVGFNAHSIAVDIKTHRIYLPLPGFMGSPTLRILMLVHR